MPAQRADLHRGDLRHGQEETVRHESDEPGQQVLDTMRHQAAEERQMVCPRVVKLCTLYYLLMIFYFLVVITRQCYHVINTHTTV